MKIEKGSVRAVTFVCAGFSLLELLVVVSIAAIIVSIALPSFVSFMDREKINSLAGEFAKSITVSRSAAMKAGVPVVLCASSDGISCAADWSDGWMAFVDNNRDGATDAADNIVLVRSGDPTLIKLAVDSFAGASVNAVRFNYRGAPDSAFSVTVSKGGQEAVVDVSPFGKPRHNE